MVCDINGLELSKGDVVAPVSGDMKGKVCGLKSEDGEGFVCVRAAHRPYSKGVWYAAEHVQRLAIGKVRSRSKTGENGEAALADTSPADDDATATARGNGKTAGSKRKSSDRAVPGRNANGKTVSKSTSQTQTKSKVGARSSAAKRPSSRRSVTTR